MSVKEKDSKPLRRLKQFFGIHKGGIGELIGYKPIVGYKIIFFYPFYPYLRKSDGLFIYHLFILSLFFKGTLKSRQDFILAPEIEQQLRKENPMNLRNRVLRELCDAVKENSVEYVCATYDETINSGFPSFLNTCLIIISFFCSE